MQRPLPLRVLLADEHRLLRSALRVSIDAEPDLAVADETASGPEAVSLAAAIRPDVVVLSLGVQETGGLVACGQLRDAELPVRVLVLAETADRSVLVRAMEAGADGFVSRDARLEDIVGAVRAVGRGEASIPSRMLGGLLQELVLRRRQQDAVVERFSRLSRREREVLALLGEGCDSAQIAAALVISPQTARTHVQNVLSKLGAHSRVEAVDLVATYDLLDRFPAREG
ncbi:MAG: LuxR C-terminal-related transcriptional regulator [Acidimicrobiales bacterium]